MGYRSEVKFIIEEFDKVKAEYAPKLLETILSYWEEDITIEDGRFLLDLDWVKWYESYPMVELVNDLWDWVEEKEINAAFGELGEDIDDNTIKYSGEDGYQILSIYRRLEV